MSSTAARPGGRGREAHIAFHEELSLGKAYDGQLVRRFWPYLRPHALTLGAALVFLLPLAGLGVAQSYLLKQAIDHGIVAGAGGVLSRIALTFVAVLLFEFGSRFGHIYLLALSGQRASANLRERLFRHVQRLSLTYFDRTPIGRVLTRVTSDVDNINEAFSMGLTAIGDAVQLVAIVVMMLSLDLKLAIVTLATLPFLAVVVEVFRRKSRVVFREIRAKIARINGYLGEQVAGMNVIQAFSRERRCREEFDEINAGYRDANYSAIRYDVGIYALVDALGDLGVACMLIYAASHLGRHGAVSAGLLVAFIDLVRRFFMPVRELSNKYTVLQSAMASLERVFQLLDVDELDAGGSSAPSLAPGGPDEGAGPLVVLDHVEFAYGRGEPVLRDVSLAVRRGERVALVGSTGAGKTTILQLVQRLYEVDRGAVLVGGLDVRAQDRTTLRRRFAVVQQDVFLFAGDVAHNVAVGDATPDLNRVRWALEQVGAVGLVMARADGLTARVEERGGNFSAGERQLLAFARALYRDPEILILDEATASVDSDTEALVQAAVQRVMQGRTALVVAHRLSTIRNADKIVVMHHGRIAELGTHEELLAQGGIYSRLYRLQFESREVAAA